MVEITAMRGEIIEKSINIEWMLHAIISQHYFGQVRMNFVYEVLYDEYCSFALKRRILFKVCPDLRSIEHQLNRLNGIRNVFAHVGVRITSLEGDAVERTPSPRDFTKSIDFEKLHEEFVDIESSLLPSLFAKYKEKGGEFSTSSLV